MPGSGTGPSFRWQSRSTRAMTLGSPWIRFAAPAMVPGPTEIGLASELLWPDAALEQSSNRSRELSAAALPVSVSRHLVSTSVQFGQSAAEKTESDQSLLVAHLLCEQLRNLVALRHDHGQNAVARTNLECIVETSVAHANSAHRHLRNFSRASTQTTPQTRPNAHYHLAVQ